jgi:excisionase family DNA binding protein
MINDHDIKQALIKCINYHFLSDIVFKRSPWLTKQEAASYLRISQKQIDRLIKKGILKCKRVDPTNPRSKILIHRTWCDRMVLGLPNGKLSTIQKSELESVT